MEKETLNDLFNEIINKAGPYSQDYTQHAENVIENASKRAVEIKARLIEALKDMMREGENGEVMDVVASIHYLLEGLGEVDPKW